jgi:hypothetical protein
MTWTSLAPWIAAIAACQREPLERLPSPQLADPFAGSQLLPPPPPPPPPPRESFVGPPRELADVMARGSCDAVVDGVAISHAAGAALVARLARPDSWVDGVVGCVTGHPTAIAISSDGPSTTLSSDCGNVVLDGRAFTWSPSMEHWFRDNRRD